MTDRYQRYVREPTPLLQAFVQAFEKHGQAQRLLSLQVFLLCAERPRTMAELEEATRLDQDKLSRAVRPITTWWDEEAGVVRRPALQLLQRRRVVFGRGHRMHVTREGRKLLKSESR